MRIDVYKISWLASTVTALLGECHMTQTGDSWGCDLTQIVLIQNMKLVVLSERTDHVYGRTRSYTAFLCISTIGSIAVPTVVTVELRHVEASEQKM